MRDESDQAHYVVDKVLEQREAGLALKQQAVLFRASHHSAPLEIELARRNVPFVKFGGLRFLEAAHVKDVIAFLRTGSLAIPRRYGAGWLVLRRHEPVARVEAQGARVAYRDVSFVVFRLSSVKTSNG